VSDSSRRSALVLGRFQAITKAQAEWLSALRTAPVDDVVCVVTSADRSGTRRNPLDAAARATLVRPLLAGTGKPYVVVGVRDIPEAAQWVEHVVREVSAAAAVVLSPSTTTLYSSNRDVDALFRAAGFPVVAADIRGLTPFELVQRIAQDKPWLDEASAETRALYQSPGMLNRLRGIFRQSLVNDDGELGHQRDFESYGAQMDASLRQKLEDLSPWVRPGCIVDKGCGTGQLLVELSRLFPASAVVGVDLSREFLRRCDENTYATDDVTLVCGNVIERNVAPGRATTVIFSSVMHEVHSYSGYRREEIDRALSNARLELVLGGRVLIRDGVSPGVSPWRLELLTAEAREAFQRFAREFKNGAGAPHERLGSSRVRLSAHLANEFLCKKDYLKNWHIEVNEEFGPHTLEGWRAALRRAGFEPIHLRTLVNPWIAQHRYEGQVALTDDAGVSLPWPATNCVVAGEKSGG
jgi:SAM-dependent methyltransferase/nicotinamide mononucleotide adenylyltransferase